jgi:hypothetical protein
MDELFVSGTKLDYRRDFSFILEIGDETEVSNVHRNVAICPLYDDCIMSAKFEKKCFNLVN